MKRVTGGSTTVDVKKNTMINKPIGTSEMFRLGGNVGNLWYIFDQILGHYKVASGYALPWDWWGLIS